MKEAGKKILDKAVEYTVGPIPISSIMDGDKAMDRYNRLNAARRTAHNEATKDRRVRVISCQDNFKVEVQFLYVLIHSADLEQVRYFKF